MNNALTAFGRFVSAENREAKFMKKYPEYAADRDSFEKGRIREYALEIKEIFNEFKKGKFRFS